MFKLLLMLLALCGQDRPGIKIDYETNGVTYVKTNDKELFFVVQDQKTLDKVLKLVEKEDAERLNKFITNFENQIAFFAFSTYNNKPDCQVSFEEINRQGPVPVGKLVFDEVHVYVDFEYIRGERTINEKKSYWRMCLVSKDKLVDVNSKKKDPLNEKTKYIMFKRVLIDTLQEPNRP